MKLENAFTIDAPADEVWTTMLDLERVAGCVPGSEVIGPSSDGGLEANIRVKVGPMSIKYRGSVVIVEQDRASRRAVMQAKAKEAQGQGTATADMVMLVRDASPVEVSIVTDLDVTGRVAQMGRGVMQDVAGRVIADFATGLRAMIVAERAVRGDTGPATGETSKPRFDGHPEQSAAASGVPTPRLTPATAVGLSSEASPRQAIGVGALIGAVLGGRLRALARWLRQLVGGR
jgi:uncharacterized protein